MPLSIARPVTVQQFVWGAVGLLLAGLMSCQSPTSSKTTHPSPSSPSSPSATNGGVVTTLAGNPNPQAVNGTGAAASFNGSAGIAIDSSGNTYVADTLNNLIRKITPAGVVSTLAGSTTGGAADGTGTAASFAGPWGVAVDSSGNVYVADSGNNMIRKITPAGVVTTLAGSTTYGSTDGTGAAASFSSPDGIAVDSSGNVYVADSNNSMIRKVTPAGVVSTLAGSTTPGSADGNGTAASFAGPLGVAVDSSGNVYVGDSSNNLIRKITPAGVVTTLAGSPTYGSANGTGTAASFGNPAGLTVDSSGNVYVADFNNNMIRKITPAGVVTTLAGSPTYGSANGTGTAASFGNPTGVAVDSSGNVYVADGGNNLIRKVTAAGVVTTLAGSLTALAVNGTGTAASFWGPAGVAVDSSGNVYVADSGNNMIRKITAAGVVTTLAGSIPYGSTNGTGTAASFSGPSGVAVDSSGNVYVADSNNHMIRKITPAGVVTTLAGSTTYGSANGNGTSASFTYPQGVAVDSSGNVYVADQGNNLIRKITPAGVVTTLAGSGAPTSGDGTGIAASFNTPDGVAVDASGNVYVADAGNNLIRKITAAGVVTTVAGSTTRGSANGTGTAASFSKPTGVAVDSSGNLYVADQANNMIRKITSAGVVTTVAGSTTRGSANGVGTAASFSSPQGVAVDSSGIIYVADLQDYLVRKIR